MKQILLLINLIFFSIISFGAGPLDGNYTINASGSGPNNYTTIADAVADLYLFGVGGEVTFDIIGTFNEQIDLDGVISGSSKFNPVVFQNGKITYAATNSTDNYLVRINSASFIEFRNNLFIAEGTTYSRIVYSDTPNGNITFDDNIFVGNSTTGSSIDRAIVYCKAYNSTENMDSFKFIDNIFNDGSYGLYLESFSTTKSSGLLISGNTFTTAFRGIRINNFDAPRISSNTITNISNSYAIHLNDCSNDFIIEKNKISTTNDEGDGIGIENCSVSSDRSLIVNNFIQACDFGIYLNNSDQIDIHFNSVNIEISPYSQDLSSAAIALQPSCTNIGLLNNILVNKRDGYSLNAGTSSGTQLFVSNYNNFYSTGDYIIRWSSFDYYSLPWLQDPNSYVTDPVFTSITDLHAASSIIDNKGTPIASVTTDIDGDLRSPLNPSIGADEYFLPLAGSYSIGPSSAVNHYNSIEAAVNDLYSSGIVGAVTFNLKDGIYDEQINLDGEIPGSSSINTVTFKELIFNDDVEIKYTATNSSNNFVLRINEAKHIIIKDLTFTASGTDYAKVVSLENVTGDLEFKDNVFNGYEITSGNGSSEQDIIYCNDDSNLNNTIFDKNELNKGRRGIALNLNIPNKSIGLIIKENIISTWGECIYVSGANAPSVTLNDLYSEISESVEMRYCTNNMLIEKNVSNNGGIYIYQFNPSTTEYGFVRNNFITKKTTGNTLGALSLYVTKYLRIYNNTILSFGSLNQNRATIKISASNSTNINIINNIIYNMVEGPAIEWETGSIEMCDYNNLYSSGPTLVKHGTTNYVTLADWQAAPEGFDENSYNSEVTFVSLTDLHIVSSAQHLIGADLPEITVDIDGDTRGTPPFIGADEATAREVSVTIMLEGPYNSSNMNTSLTNSLPEQQPYSSPIHSGNESVASNFFDTHTNIVDWVAVELRSDVNTKVTSRAGFLLDTGQIVDLDGSSPLKFVVESENYWLVVHHRNHLSVMSASAVLVN